MLLLYSLCSVGSSEESTGSGAKESAGPCHVAARAAAAAEGKRGTGGDCTSLSLSWSHKVQYYLPMTRALTLLQSRKAQREEEERAREEALRREKERKEREQKEEQEKREKAERERYAVMAQGHWP